MPGWLALYAYVAPVLTVLTGVSDGFVTPAPGLIELGFTFGNWLDGRVADWSLGGTTTIFLAVLAAIILVAPLTLRSQTGVAITLILWSAVTFAIAPPGQMRVFQAVSEASGMASSVNIGALRLGDAIGAALGGAVIAADPGYVAVPVAGGLVRADHCDQRSLRP